MIDESGMVGDALPASAAPEIASPDVSAMPDLTSATVTITDPGEHAELHNLAADLQQDELDGIARTVLDDFKRDDESRAEWLSMHAEWIRLYFQRDEPINPPWTNSSKESMPLLTEACNQFHARARKAFFPNRNVIKCVPTGKSDQFSEERAKRVSAHMTWQLIDSDRSYRKNMDRALLAAAVHGGVFRKAYFDPLYKKNVVKNVRLEDLVIPYGSAPRELEDMDRKTEIIWMSVNEGAKYAKTGYFVIAPERWEEQEDREETKIAADEAEGLTPPSPAGDDFGDTKILEQHRLLDLDNDGIAEPYIVTVDAQAEKVLRISIRYETDRAGKPLDGKKPIEYYTLFPFLENPDGSLPLGLGHLIGKINSAVNKLVRQTIDAGTLATVGNQSGFISSAVDAKKGELEFQLGKFVKVQGTGEDISRGIFQFKFPGPSNVLTEMISALISRSDRLATSTEAMTGQLDQFQQPTTVLALIDQGLEMFNAVFERLFLAWEEELNKLYRLNSRYLDEQAYFALLDNDGTVRNPKAQIGRGDYADDMQVTPLPDPKMATEHKRLTKAQMEYQFESTNPLIMNNPQALYKASRRFLEAMDVERIDEVLPPPGSTEPPRIDDPSIENFHALYPKPDMPPVHSDQNHLEHIKVHDQLLNDPHYGPQSGMMTPEGAQMLQAHKQTHIALMYAMTETNYPKMAEQQHVQ